ncbi:uncharacterized protein LOC144713719 [Wolffia australiana]
MGTQRSSKDGARSKQARRASKLKEQPPFSGAQIRNLVRQLTAARPREPSSDALPISSVGSCIEALEEATSPSPPLRRKQKRRRLYSRQHQQRLINVAGARREIIAALKLHRSAMNLAKAELPAHPASPLPISLSAASSSSSSSSSPPREQPDSAILHRAMSEEEMTVIRSIGLLDDIEWSEQLNTAWWLDFLNEKSKDGVSPPELQEKSTEALDSDLPW